MASQKKLSDFFTFKSKASITPECIVKSIIDDLIPVVVRGNVKHHDGQKVTEKTLKNWEKGFPWLSVKHETESRTGESVIRLKCKLCSEHRMKTVWAIEGTTNVQKSSIDRHSESEPHIEATKLSVLKDKVSTNILQYTVQTHPRIDFYLI